MLVCFAKTHTYTTHMLTDIILVINVVVGEDVSKRIRTCCCDSTCHINISLSTRNDQERERERQRQRRANA